jgi:hypothetical protein
VRARCAGIVEQSQRHRAADDAPRVRRVTLDDPDQLSISCSGVCGPDRVL